MIVVDQSVRIEDTSHDTVLALHDTDADKPSALYGRHNTRAVLIPAEVKRRCFGELRDRGLLRKTIVLRVFAAALFLLLEEHLMRGARVLIDDEYPGHSATIRSMLIGWVRQRGWKCDPVDIQFASVGRRSLAHQRAIRVTRRQQKADRVLSARKIMALL